MPKKYLVTAPPPTPNGDLHVGHIAGPYMAADVFSRFQRIRGNEVIYVSGSDQHQTYVVTAGERLGEDPVELGRKNHFRIKESLEKCAIQTDAFNFPDEEHARAAQELVQALKDKGALQEKEIGYWYSEHKGRYLFEAYINGFCSNCHAETKGAICESCGHPNDSIHLHLPSATGSTQPIITKKTKSLFLPLENYRERLTEYLAQNGNKMRPHLRQLFEDLLAAPLPDFPVTYPSDYGIRYPGMEGQVINVWVEMVSGHMLATTKALKEEKTALAWDALWKRDAGYELVQFLGYDNSFFYAIAHLALLFELGDDYIVPKNFIINEFCLLDNFKFSTSQNHVIWARDIINSITTDELRFFLAYTNPEYYQTNFNSDQLKIVTTNLLIDPLKNLVELYNRLLNPSGRKASLEACSQVFKDRLAWFERGFRAAYSEDQFSLTKAVHLLSDYIKWLVDYGCVLAKQQKNSCDLSIGMVALVAFSHPLLPEFSEKLRLALGIETAVSWSLAETVDTHLKEIKSPFFP